MLSPGNSTFALSPVGRKKPATLPVPEPRNCAKTQAKACQEKQSAAVRGLCQPRPVVVKRDCKRDLWCSWRRSWDLVESAVSHWLWTRFTTSRSCVVESRVKSAKRIFQGVWDMRSLGQPVLYQPDCLEVQEHDPLGDGGLQHDTPKCLPDVRLGRLSFQLCPPFHHSRCRVWLCVVGFVPATRPKLGV